MINNWLRNNIITRIAWIISFVLTGFAVVYTTSVPHQTLAVLTFLILVITTAFLNFLYNREGNPFSPFLLFPTIYLFYFGIGAINFSDTLSVSFRSHIPQTQYFYYSLGITSYFLGLLLSTLSKSTQVGSFYTNKIDLRKLRLVGLSWIGLSAISSGIIITKYGITVLNPYMRHNVSPLLVHLLYTGVVGGLLLFIAYHDRLLLAATVLIMASGIMLVAWPYRSPIVLLFGMAIAIHFQLRKRYSIKRYLFNLVLVILIFIFIGGMFTLYRLRERGVDLTSIDYRLGLELPSELNYWWLVPVSLWSNVREGPSVFYSLTEKLGEKFEYGNGKIWFSSFVTLLPGSQQSAREIISIIANDGIYTSSLTPSILGTFYADFGIFGIILFMLFVGWLLGRFYKLSSHNICGLLFYSYFLIAFTMAIHSGWFDPMRVIFLPLLLWVSLKWSIHS